MTLSHLGHMFVCHQIKTCTRLLKFKDNALEPNNTHNMSQIQMGERRPHGWTLCCWSNFFSIVRFWSDHQHDLKGGYLQPFYNSRFSTMHVPGLHQDVLSSFEKKEIGPLQTPLLCVQISMQSGLWQEWVHSCSNKVMRLLGLADVDKHK